MVFLLVNAERNRWNPPLKIVPTYKLNIGAKQSIFNLRNRGGNMVDFKHQTNNQVQLQRNFIQLASVYGFLSSHTPKQKDQGKKGWGLLKNKFNNSLTDKSI